MGPLDGKWKVTVIGWSQPWKVLNVLGDVKVINGDRGYNQFKTGRWGWFNIEWTGTDSCILNYDVPGNDEPFRKIVDHLHRVNDKRWGGIFYYRIPDGKVKVFKFRLDRIRDGS